MKLKEYKMIQIVLYISILLASHTASSRTDLKRKLKESSSERFKIKKHIPDISDSDKCSQKYVFKQAVGKRCIDNNKNKKQLPKDVKNKERLAMSNPQVYTAAFESPENKKTSLLNGQEKILEEETSASRILSETNTTSNFEEECWNDLLTTTGPKKIRHYYGNQMRQRRDEASVYSYSNSTFLNRFLNFPSPSFTADSIRVRFGSGFLNFLSTDQLTGVLSTLLSRDLELTKAERSEIVETIFGCIDFSLEMIFNNNQIVSIATALLTSDVPHCFEQVFLTWKMWKVFTIEEQEKMLEGVISDTSQDDEIIIKYKKETLIMLYLFMLNKDTDNSSKCEPFKKSIIRIYKESQIFNGSNNILTFFDFIKMNLSASDTLDTSLLELPNMFKKIGNTILTEFKCEIRGNINYEQRYLSSAYFGKRYKIHMYYVLTKFTQENPQNNNGHDTNIYDNLYFDSKYIRDFFSKWISTNRNNHDSGEEREVNEFRNAYGAMRQIIQSDGYDFMFFFELFYTMNTKNNYDKNFALILFNLTKEDILRDVKKTLNWTRHEKNRSTLNHRFIYIEDIFMANADANSTIFKAYSPITYLKRITGIMNKLINVRKDAYRERYLYQQLLFHPKLKIFNDAMIKFYVSGLKEVGQLENKERRVQIARDLIFNEYYYEAAVKLKSLLAEINDDEKFKEFIICLEKECERYKNKTDIEKEREAFKKCCVFS